MRIAITMQSFEVDLAPIAEAAPTEASTDCFAEFEVNEGTRRRTEPREGEENDTVQVTVVLRGKREELENPALGMTNLILSALRSHRAGNHNNRARQVIEAMGLGVENAC